LSSTGWTHARDVRDVALLVVADWRRYKCSYVTLEEALAG